MDNLKKTSRKNLYKSGEDYLEAIFILRKNKGMVRSINLARHMGFSKTSISHAIEVFRKGDFLTMDEDGIVKEVTYFLSSKAQCQVMYLTSSPQALNFLTWKFI